MSQLSQEVGQTKESFCYFRTSKERLVAFLSKYQPDKLDIVADILEKYKDREGELFHSLVKKYGPEPRYPLYRNNSSDDDSSVSIEYSMMELKFNASSDHKEQLPYTCIDFEGENVLTPLFSSNDKNSTRHTETPSPIPPPEYHHLINEEQPSVTQKYPIMNYTHNLPRTPPPSFVSPPNNDMKSQECLILPNRISSRENFSPSSHDSCSKSRTTTRSWQSNNTSNNTISTSLSGTVSCGATVTSSLIEADREVMETNRRERYRRENVNLDLDGTVSVHSSDSASTNTHAYLALASSPASIRDGASMPVERFLSSGGLNVIGWNNSVNNGRHVSSVCARSHVTLSSNSLANTASSVSTVEEPPRFVSCPSSPTLRAIPVKLCSSSKSIPSRYESDELKRTIADDGIAYTILGSEKKVRRPSINSYSNCSTSKSYKKKDKTRKYKKLSSKYYVDPSSIPVPYYSFPGSPDENNSRNSPCSLSNNSIDFIEHRDFHNLGADFPQVLRNSIDAHLVHPKGKLVSFSPKYSGIGVESTNVISPHEDKVENNRSGRLSTGNQLSVLIENKDRKHFKAAFVSPDKNDVSLTS